MKTRRGLFNTLLFLNILLFGAIAWSTPGYAMSAEEDPCDLLSPWCDCITEVGNNENYCAEIWEPVEDPMCSWAEPFCDY